MCFWNDTHAHLSAELSLAGVPMAASATSGRHLVDDATTAPDRESRAAGPADGVVVARFPRQRTIGLNLSF